MSKKSDQIETAKNQHIQAGRLPKEVTPSERAKAALITTKVDLVRAYPFLGFLVMSTEYYFTDELPTLAATTHPKNYVFINEKFLLKGLPTRKQRSFVFAHEILHIFLEHIGRQMDHNYHRGLWNVATDHCINLFLTALNSRMMERPKSALYDERFKGMSADEIYHLILEENDGDAEKAAQEHGAGSEGGDYGDGQQRPFDEVSDEQVTDAAKAENKQKISAALSQTDPSAIKQMGDGAVALIREFERLVASVIPWNQVLREYITSQSAAHYTYNRISRRSTKNIVFPTLDGDFVDLVFGVDTSGSMSSDDLKEAMSELQGICNEFDNWRVTLLSCDTTPHVIGEYLSEEGDDFSTIDKALIGGGGTDMSPMVEFANDMEDEPSVVVILTDGYIPEIKNIEEIPVICVVTTNGNKDLQLNDALVLQMSDKGDE